MTDDQRYNDSNQDEAVNQPDVQDQENATNGGRASDLQNNGHTTPEQQHNGYQSDGYQHYQQPSAGASPVGPSGPHYSNSYNQPYGQAAPNQYGQAQANELMLMEYPGNEKRLVKVASRGIRFGAYLIDSFISGIPSAIIAIFFMIKFFQLIWTPYTGLMNYVDPGSGMIVNFDHFLSVNYSDIRAMIFWFIALLVVSLLAQILFFALIPIWTNGQTLGKKMLKLRAVHEDGRYLSTGAQLLRGLVGVILLAFVTSNMTMWISAVMILVTDKRQGIHDYMASSVVISEKAF